MARLRVPALILAAVALWVALLRLPAMAPGSGVDDSWFLAFAFFFKQRAQAGTDYIFTYGPLGYFMQRAYDSELFAAKYAWELVLKALFVAVAFGFLRQLRNLAARGACYLALLALPAGADDAQYTWFILLLGIQLTGRADASPLLLIGGALLLAVLGLVKFTFLLFGALVVAVLAAERIAAGKGARGALPGAAFALGLALAWLAVGQRLGNFPRYLRASWEMSAGYTDAMSFGGRTGELVAAVAVLVLLAATLIGRRPDAPRLLLLGFAGYLAWKNGFVRHDIHAASFFALALLMTFSLPVAFDGFDWRAPPRLAALLSAGLLSAGCLVWTTGADATATSIWRSPILNLGRGALGLIDAPGLKARLEARQSYLRESARLPRIQRIVGDEPIDVFGNNQSPALQNGMNWRPRPVFQSYAAYTPWLIEQNGLFFEGSRAPRYVLLSLIAIDRRFPAHEDPAALRSILARYRPVAAEHRYLLLERSAPPLERNERAVHFELQFGQAIAVAPDAGAQVFHFEIEKSWLGKLASLILKPPAVRLTVQRQDRETWIYHLVPSMARAGFVLDPLLLETDDVLDAYTAGGPPRRAERCAVQTSWAGRRCYRPKIRVEVDAVRPLTTVRIGDDERAALKAQLGPPPIPQPGN